MTSGPRIYNLFPLLAGAITDWPQHLPRIERMGFDWIYLNPFQYPGFSGSLYAIKDFDELHPVVRGGSREPSDDLIRTFVEQAAAHGCSVMVDLVINHTSKDALLATTHPEWYRREPDGALRSPRAVDPVDPRKATVWGDLAEIDYCRPHLHAAQIDCWSELVRRYLRLGVRGFRCDAAYQVPAQVWRPIIDAAQAERSDTLFAAETLGCTTAQVEALREAGFDYLFNSAKWWNFHESWLLDQYDQFRRIGPSIAFPESHDTERLSRELGMPDREELERHYRLRYAFAALFSTGVMMPMGYEFGFGKRLHVVDSRPGDWAWEAENPRLDLVEFIAATNRTRAETPAVNVEGLQRRVTAPHSPALALLRFDTADGRSADSAAFTVINPDAGRTHGVDVTEVLSQTSGRFEHFEDATPLAQPKPFLPGETLPLAPLELRLFRARATGPNSVYRTVGGDRASARRLQSLAEQRIAIEKVYPEIDGGRFPVKRIVGDVLDVTADIFGEGHDAIDACVKYRVAGERPWQEVPMRHLDNDRWAGSFPLTRNARYEFTIEAWRDLFASWRSEISKKHDAGQNVSLELTEGRHLVEATAQNLSEQQRRELEAVLARIEDVADTGEALTVMLSEELRALMKTHSARTNASRYERCLEVYVDRPEARFAAWYEIFPRSQSGDPGRHGTFDDVIRRLPDIRDMGFDVLYFTPIHPVGRTNRKGRNNSLTPGPGDPGSPYAIGAAEGGHDAVHPALGTLADFRRLVTAAYDHGLELALDFAIQCSPDHPWLKEHPEWFDWRPDGTIKSAENPPKKYEDIVNVHFYRGALPALWYALRDVVLFWVQQGVKIFRVDNPHTKPLPFWEWMIRDIQDRHPDVIFLSEAFTRPKMMKRLAKIGFTQSYTYFTWRTGKSELIEYLTELTQDEPREYYRPNFFANTPDINPPILHSGKRAAFMTRGLLAATLSSAYGLYNGFELCEGTPVPGKEEYLNSEKYEIKAWDYDRPGNIRDFIRRINRIRRDNPALHDHLNLRFYNAWNDDVLVYGKMTRTKDNVILVAVNLDPDHAHGATFEVPLWELGLPDNGRVEVEDLLGTHRFVWDGKVQQVWLDPETNPCAIWRIVPPGL